MLDLIAISYHNIGPFKDQLISIFFKMGKFLIKAPIGSGKSFLFFDGPSYALYKSAPRNLLNIQSKTWYIKLLFEIDGNCYLIKRNLKTGRSKDSCSSQLFSVNTDSGQTLLEKIQGEKIVESQLDIETILQKNQIPLEEIVFKNETDLQQQLQEMLPPIEVFTSTIFLLQDAGNIFEMQPAPRMEVLKNIFWLLSIDKAKEIVREKRTEVRYQIKAYQDFSSFDEKLKKYLKRLSELFIQIASNPLLKEVMKEDEASREELHHLSEKLSIQGFEITLIPNSFINQAKNIITSEKERYQNYLNQIQVIQQQLQEKKLSNENINKEQYHLNNKIKELELLIQQADKAEWEKLKQERQELIKEQELVRKVTNLKSIQDFFENHKKSWNLESQLPQEINSTYQLIQELITLGKIRKSESSRLHETISNLHNMEQLEKNKQAEQINYREEKLQFFVTEEEKLRKILEKFEGETQNQAHFFCEKTQEPCPFVTHINKQHFQQREEQKASYLAELEQLLKNKQESDLENKLQEIKERRQKAEEETQYQEKIKIHQQEQKELEEKILKIRNFLSEIDHQTLEQQSQKMGIIVEKSLQLDKRLLEKEKLIQELEQHQKNLQSLEIQSQQLQNTQKELSIQQDKLNEQERNLINEKNTIAIESIQLSEEAISNYHIGREAVEQIIKEVKDLQIKTKNLIEEEKLLWNLYKVLNKDLLLYVLGEYLPILWDIINNYLSGVVDFQIILRLAEESEKIELEMLISDQHGTREVKSLSGGQKTVLKLVWMLAVSSYLQTKLLFLDETINNLDVETVGKVAKMIEDFVQQRTMKFYTITHNSEIQEMNIWDESLTISNKEQD